eukprot:TRINITY_DN57685_c0_g1_i1.p1 TRINITY_DN57685_c0_g1~~TRINITY_DN57685_c0_g1_i1.p1  ORF type:complete len:446 (+),score=25.82 TRINITY_DN57685_c0_g1_i1:150-1340(+)
MGTYCQAPPPAWTPLPDNFKLLQVHFVHRHGDRTPVHSYSWLPYFTWNCTLNNYQTTTSPDIPLGDSNTFSIRHLKNSPLKGDCNPGQLTKLGFQQAYELGRVARKHYVDNMKFLSSAYPGEKEAVVYTASDLRCLQTCEGVLNGLWPANGNISVIQFSTAEDYTDPLEKVCTGPKIKQWATEAKNSPEVKKFTNTTLDPYRKAVEEHWHRGPLSFIGFYHVWDTFAAARCHNQISQMPKFITDDWLTQVALVVKEYFRLTDTFAKIHKYNAAPFLAEMLPFFTALQQSTASGASATPKWVQWGVHDATIEAILEAFGTLPAKPWVGYASSYIVEVAEDTQTGAKWVRRIYNGRVEGVHSGANPEWNSLDSFIKLLNAWVPADWRDVCFGTGEDEL